MTQLLLITAGLLIGITLADQSWVATYVGAGLILAGVWGLMGLGQDR